ncbi:uncharacterized protein LOC144119699 [Amblyomma americanum]
MVHFDNLHTLSLTSCVGKLMETMVCDRLSSHIEGHGFFAGAMHGFRPHMSAADILLQLQQDVILAKRRDKVIIALYMEGAFDNVKHDSILSNLSSTKCAPRAFAYVRDFRSQWRALLRINDQGYGPHMETRGTPQRDMLPPSLLNIAMMELPKLLQRVEGVHHALCADITRWASMGSIGVIEGRLQQEATLVDTYANGCGLICAPPKRNSDTFAPSRRTPLRCTSTAARVLCAK